MISLFLCLSILLIFNRFSFIFKQHLVPGLVPFLVQFLVPSLVPCLPSGALSGTISGALSERIVYRWLIFNSWSSLVDQTTTIN